MRTVTQSVRWRKAPGAACTDGGGANGQTVVQDSNRCADFTRSTQRWTGFVGRLTVTYWPGGGGRVVLYVTDDRRQRGNGIQFKGKGGGGPTRITGLVCGCCGEDMLPLTQRVFRCEGPVAGFIYPRGTYFDTLIFYRDSRPGFPFAVQRWLRVVSQLPVRQ